MLERMRSFLVLVANLVFPSLGIDRAGLDAAIVFPSPSNQRPGLAEAFVENDGSKLLMRNRVLEVSWTLKRNALGHLALYPDTITNRLTHSSMPLPQEAFSLYHGKHDIIQSSLMIANHFRLSNLTPLSNASHLGSTFGGWRAEIDLQYDGLVVVWSAELRDDANYLRSVVSLRPELNHVLEMEQLVLFDAMVPGAEQVGEPPGNVMRSNEFFFGFEHPQAENGDGSLPSADGGMVLKRFIPGERYGQLKLDADISRFYLHNHRLDVYLDNWKCDVPVHILGVELVDSSGTAIASDFGHKGIASKSNTKGNIFVIQPLGSQAIGSNSSKVLVRFHLKVEGNYTGEWVLGLHRKGLKDHAFCSLRQRRRIRHGRGFEGSMVFGVSPLGQIRRAFLHYLERERAHPTRPMLHYNSWYDIGTGNQFTAKEAYDRLNRIGVELQARGLSLDSFLLDDGWDDPDVGPWEPHKGFDNASLIRLEKLAASFNTGLGAWFSPFGGYHEPRQRRVLAAHRARIPVREETAPRVKAVKRSTECTRERPCNLGEGTCADDAGCSGHLICFRTTASPDWPRVSPPGLDASDQDKSLSFCCDPGVHSAFLGLGIGEYYTHFREIVSTWLSRGARLLKLDGIGNPAGGSVTSPADFDAALSFIADLRRVSRDIFINLSTGTWPSPFWLLHSDTVWRRGHDHYFEGDGCARERWITYRDDMVHKNVVARAPFFPLNSLMVHGVIFAKDAWDLNKPEGSGAGTSDIPFRHEVRSAFGSGTMLQELYVTPSLLSGAHWDDIVAAATWVRPLMGTLADVHWIGGSPAAGEVYGWAAWRDAHNESVNQTAVLTIRNPSALAKSIDLDAAAVFELPLHAGRVLNLISPYSDQRPRSLQLTVGRKVSLRLEPFDVLVFDSLASPATELELLLDTVFEVGKPVVLTTVLCIVAFLIYRSRKHQEANVPDADELRRRRMASLDRMRNPGSTLAAGRVHID